MKKYIKTGLLAALLVVPVFVALLLNTFGKNHYELHRLPGGEKYLKDEQGNIKTLPAFSLTDQQGKPFTEKALQGKVVIADFFFSRCQGICPKMSSQLTRVQETFDKNPDVVLVSHTVDPEYDSVKILNNYAEEFGAHYGKWYLLTGPKPDLYNLARYGYFLPVGKGDGGEADFIHSEKVVLLDKKGRIRGFYNGTDALQVDTLIIETRVLLQENNEE